MKWKAEIANKMKAKEVLSIIISDIEPWWEKGAGKTNSNKSSLFLDPSTMFDVENI